MFKIIEGPSFFAVSNEPNSYLRVEDDVLMFTTKEQARRVCDALNHEKLKINWLRLFIIAFCIMMSIFNIVLYSQGRFDSGYLALCLEFFIIVPCLIIWVEGGK